MITEVIHQPPSWKVWSASSQGREFLKTKHTQNYTGLFIYFLLRPFFFVFFTFGGSQVRTALLKSASSLKVHFKTKINLRN